jgi:two-component system invasion response regulator UvrY
MHQESVIPFGQVDPVRPAVVIVARDRLLLDTISGAPDLASRVNVVGTSLELVEGLQVVARVAPSLLVVDELNFLTGFRWLADCLPVRLKQTRLLLFVDRLSDMQLDLAISIGVSGLLSHQDSIATVLQALQLVHDGGTFMASDVAERLTHDPRSGRWIVRRRSTLSDITDSQLEVLVLLAEGLRVKEIADRMQISEKAVESHKYRLMSRLGIHDRVELCRWAIREGLIVA